MLTNCHKHFSKLGVLVDNQEALLGAQPCRVVARLLQSLTQGAVEGALAFIDLALRPRPEGRGLFGLNII